MGGALADFILRIVISSSSVSGGVNCFTRTHSATIENQLKK